MCNFTFQSLKIPKNFKKKKFEIEIEIRSSSSSNYSPVEHILCGRGGTQQILWWWWISYQATWHAKQSCCCYCYEVNVNGIKLDKPPNCRDFIFCLVQNQKMASSASSSAAISITTLSSSFLASRDLTLLHPIKLVSSFHHNRQTSRISHKRSSQIVKAAKLPAGVKLPKVQPKFQAPFLGFTRTAEIWNSRACMIGLIGTFIVELILNKGILQLIGVEIGKGLDLPL